MALVASGTKRDWSIGDPPCEYPLEVAVFLPSEIDPQQYATNSGFVYVGGVGELVGYHLMRAGCASARAEQKHLLEDMTIQSHARTIRYGMRMPTTHRPAEMVQVPHILLARGKKSTSWETYMAVSGRWPLRDYGVVATWVNNTWLGDHAGDGTTLVIVDDGLDYLNPDLNPRYDADVSRNFNIFSGYGEADPRPTPGNVHGTDCGGVAAGAGADGLPPNLPLCSHGVAFKARLGGIRLISDAVTDATEGAAMAHMCADVTVKSCSWGPADGGVRLGSIGPLSAVGFAYCARTGNHGLGTSITVASGNGGTKYNGIPRDNCYYDAYAQQVGVLAIGAVSSLGAAAYYSEACGAVFVSAPSSGSGVGITTTMPTTMSSRPYCRNDFGGTSAAAPFVAGVIALSAGANPRLTRLDIEEILARTAWRVDPHHPGWQLNAAGYWYNTQYGFGMVNASAAVEMAQRYQASNRTEYDVAVSPVFQMRWYRSTITADPPGDTEISRHSMQVTSRISSRTFPAVIPNTRGAAAVVWTDFQNMAFVIRRVKVTLTLLHPRRSQLTFALVSPSGTRMLVANRPLDSGANLANWEFMFVGYRGERAFGTWALVVLDNTSGDAYSGTITAVQFTFYGFNVDPVRI